MVENYNQGSYTVALKSEIQKKSKAQIEKDSKGPFDVQ